MGKIYRDSENDYGRATKPICTKHTFISIHQPDMPIYYIVQCETCGYFNAKELEKDIRQAGYTKVKDSRTYFGRTELSRKEDEQDATEELKGQPQLVQGQQVAQEANGTG